MAVRSFIGLGLVMAGLAAGTPLGWWLRQRVLFVERSAEASHPTPPGAPSPSPTPGTGPVEETHVGTFGLIESHHVYIEPPTDAVTPEQCDPTPPTWRLKGYTKEAFASLLDAAHVSPADRGWLLQNVQCLPDGCFVTPTEAIVYALTSESRSVIYQELAATSANRNVLFGFRSAADAQDQWLAESGLTSDLLSRFQKLSYREASLVRMSDVWALCAAARSPEERVRVSRSMSRTPALVARLKMPAGGSVHEITRYWAVDGLARDVRPLLESVARVPGSAIGLEDLLPRLAREKLNKYPRIGAGPQYDCLWTSMNFFADIPDDRFLVQGEAERALAAEYDVVPFTRIDDLAYGDVVAFYAQDGTLQHVAVHIAADVMFTKNGLGTWNPWTLMCMRHLRAIYSLLPTLKAYRKKII